MTQEEIAPDVNSWLIGFPDSFISSGGSHIKLSMASLGAVDITGLKLIE